MYVVTLSVFHNLAIWLLYVNKPEPRLQLDVRNLSLGMRHQVNAYKVEADTV